MEKTSHYAIIIEIYLFTESFRKQAFVRATIYVQPQ